MQLGLVELFLLVGDVATFARLTQAVALDGGYARAARNLSRISGIPDDPAVAEIDLTELAEQYQVPQIQDETVAKLAESIVKAQTAEVPAEAPSEGD